MFHQREPIVGTWFVNQTGKLFKVKMIVISEHLLQKVMVEYLDGTKRTIKAAEWYCLKLNIQIDQASLNMKLH
jgi:hypothetical protein